MTRWFILTMITCLMVSTAAFALSTGEEEASDLSIALQTAPANEGKVQVLKVTHADGSPAAGMYVYARYYPRTTVQKGEHVCQTGADGTCEWTPAFAGLTKLRVDDHQIALTSRNVPTDSELTHPPLATQTFSVRFDGVPLGGVIIFAIAFLILFGTLFWSMTELLLLAPRRAKKAEA